MKFPDEKTPDYMTELARFPSPPPASLASPKDAPRGDVSALTATRQAAAAEIMVTPGAEQAGADAAYRQRLMATIRLQQTTAANVAGKAALKGAAWGLVGAFVKLGIAYYMDKGARK